MYVTGRPDMQLQKVVSWLAQHNFPHGLVSFADGELSRISLLPQKHLTSKVAAFSGFTTDPLRHKADFLKGLKTEQDISLHCAYGSAKDIAVYAGLGLRPDQVKSISILPN